MENRESYKVEDHVLSRSLTSENAETSIKVEIDTYDDYVWESTIEISQENIVNDYVWHNTIEMSEDVDIDNKNNVELLFESQDNTVNNINDFNDTLKNNLAEDKIQLNLKTNECKYCEKKFKLNIALNKHVQKYHKYNEIQDNIKSIKQEEYSNENAKDKNTSYEILNSQSAVSVAPHNPITHNWPDLSIKEDKYMSTNVVETNISDQIILPNINESMILTVSHNSIVKDCNDLNIKQEKTTQSSVQMDLINDNETSYSDINGLNNSASIIQKKEFFCNPCERIFYSLVKFKAHQASHLKPQQSFSCKYCDRTFTGRGQCTNHEKSHITQKKKKSTNVRGRRSSDQIHLMNSNATVISTTSNNSVTNDFDIQRKKKIKQEEYSNENVKDTNTSYEILNSQSAVFNAHHNSITHNWPDLNIKEEKYMSTNVVKTNNSDQINLPNGNESMILTTVSHSLIVEDYNVLNIKQENKCKKIKSKFCVICNEHFAHLDDLRNHINMHMDRKPFQCQYCSQQFSRERPYILHKKKHMLMNNDQKPMIEFTSNQDSKNFIKSPRYKCNYCEKTYSTLSRRLTHMKKFHIESDKTGSFIITYNKPNQSVQCKICLKTISSRHLSQHMRIHSDDTLYTCFKCNKDFRYISDFTQHMRNQCGKYNQKLY